MHKVAQSLHTVQAIFVPTSKHVPIRSTVIWDSYQSLYGELHRLSRLFSESSVGSQLGDESLYSWRYHPQYDILSLNNGLINRRMTSWLKKTRPTDQSTQRRVLGPTLVIANTFTFVHSNGVCMRYPMSEDEVQSRLDTAFVQLSK